MYVTLDITTSIVENNDLISFKKLSIQVLQYYGIQITKLEKMVLFLTEKLTKSRAFFFPSIPCRTIFTSKGLFTAISAFDVMFHRQLSFDLQYILGIYVLPQWFWLQLHTPASVNINMSIDELFEYTQQKWKTKLPQAVIIYIVATFKTIKHNAQQ